MADDATIRILPLGGAWETLGSDRLRGIVPEGIEASADSWGPSQMTFQLKAEAGARRPDVLPFTPVELEVGGMLVWAGFVWDRPSDANSYSVGCRGWQFHLDDDLYDRVYVATRLSDFKDIRSSLTATLGVGGWLAAGQVSNEGGLMLSIPNGTAVVTGSSCGAYLDLGPDSTAKRVVITWSAWGAGAGNQGFIVKGANGPDDTSWPGEDIYNAGTLVGPTTTAATFATPRRYIHLAVTQNGAPATYGADVWVRISDIKIFRATAYESGNASILKSSQVQADALTLAPLLNQSSASITAGTFSLPSFLTNGYITPRSAIEAANLVENYRTRIAGADLKTLAIDAKPTAPVAEVGEWSGSQFDDATVTGEPIYNRAILDGTGPDGSRLVSKRTQTGDLVTRRGFTRSARVDVSTAVTSAVADRINDLWLSEHKTAPFAGTLKIVGGGARRPLSGQSIPPQTFLLYSGEKVRLSNRVDPDTGNWGRDGRIAGVTYRHNDRSVEISIDDQRHLFEEILARYAALVGG